MCRRLEVHPARESPKLAHRPGASQVSPYDDDDDEEEEEDDDDDEHEEEDGGITLHDHQWTWHVMQRYFMYCNKSSLR